MALESGLSGELGFVAASYGVAAIVALALIGWVIVDYRLQKQRLAELEKHGAPRRLS